MFWIDRRDLSRDLYAQHLTMDGATTPGWPQNGVKFGTGIGELWRPIGIPDGFGGAIIVWEDLRDLNASGHNIYAQRVTADGTIAPGWPVDGLAVCTAPGEQRVPRLAPDDQGGAFVVWDDSREDPQQEKLDIYAQRIMSDGSIAPGWAVDGKAICTAPERQANPSLAPDGTGGVIIVWADTRNFAVAGADLYAQRVTGSGQVAEGWTAEGTPVCTAEGSQIRPEVVADGQGGAIVLWKDARSLPGSGENDGYEDLYAQRILGDGSVAAGWPENGVPLCTAPRTQQSLSAASDGLGGAIVAWEDYRSYSSAINTAADIYAQRITGEGVIPAGWPTDGVGLCTVGSFQLNPTLATDGAGGAYVSWEDTRSGVNADIYAQHVTAAGEVAFGWEPNGVAVCTQPAAEPGPVVAADGFGGVIVAWEDSRNGGLNLDIFAQRLGVDGPVPALVSLVSKEATAEGVLLIWQGTEAAALHPVVQRRTGSGVWETLGLPVAESQDRLRYLDSSVQLGGRYGYRLAYQSESGEQFTDEVWVDVPVPSLALAGFRPNPARGDLVVAFSLSSAEPATLEVLSVTGRVILSREVGFLGVGDHVINLGDRRGLAAGVHWLRLSQSGRRLVTKGIIF